MSDFGSQPSSGESQTPAGWYAVDGGQQRYWDGTQWTEHMMPSAAPATTPGSQPFIPATAYGQVDGGGAVSSDDRSMAVIAHVLSLFVGFLAPLVIWLIKRDESPFIDHHGKEALNFQITLFIAWVVAFIGSLILIGLLVMPFLLVAQFVFPIMAAVAANSGKWYRYPITLRLIS